MSLVRLTLSPSAFRLECDGVPADRTSAVTSGLTIAPGRDVQRLFYLLDFAFSRLNGPAVTKRGGQLYIGDTPAHAIGARLRQLSESKSQPAEVGICRICKKKVPLDRLNVTTENRKGWLGICKRCSSE